MVVEVPRWESAKCHRKRNLDVIAGLVIVAGEEEQGKNSGERAGGIFRVVPKWEGQGGARMLVAEVPVERGHDQMAALATVTEEDDGEEARAAATVGEVAVVGPQRENAGSGCALFPGMATKVEGQEALCSGRLGAIVEIPVERKKPLAWSRRDRCAGSRALRRWWWRSRECRDSVHRAADTNPARFCRSCQRRIGGTSQVSPWRACVVVTAVAPSGERKRAVLPCSARLPRKNGRMTCQLAPFSRSRPHHASRAADPMDQPSRRMWNTGGTIVVLASGERNDQSRGNPTS